MKKIFTLLLAVLMIASMSVTAFAAETSATVGGDDQQFHNQTIDVKGTYVAGKTAGGYDYVSADITWGAMEFTYYAADESVWDPSTHSYTATSEAKWEANENVITVANHSEFKMIVALIFAKNENITTELSASVEFEGDDDDFADQGIDSDGIPYAVLVNPVEGSTYDTAPSLTATITLEGALPSDWGEGETIGTITLVLSSAGR